MKKDNRIIIIGAGFSGQAIAKEIMKNSAHGKVIAFIDDDKDKIGTSIDDIPVFGPINIISTLFDGLKGDDALIAIPSLTHKELKRIVKIVKTAAFKRIRIVPSVSQIVSGDAHLVQTRELDPQDFLGRTPIHIDLKKTLKFLHNKRIVITGAGGSIGSELSQQLLMAGAERIYLFGHGENSIYQIDQELRRLQAAGVGEKSTIVPVIGDLQDRDYMHFIIKRLKADFIFHTAAHKHVPMMEKNPVEAVKNNVFGTKNLVDAIEAAGIGRLIFISTDKAVNPSCVYGASKKLAEMIVMGSNTKSNQFSVVRFGNVLGARGSIVPLFRNQIMDGGPVTITHPHMSRFYMTISEAVSLVLQTAGIGEHCSLYLLDMGEPIKIVDLAETMIKFYGYTTDQIPLTFIGLREGEKLHEKLHDEKFELPQKTTQDRILKIVRADGKKGAALDIDPFKIIEELEPICFLDSEKDGLYRNRQLLRKTLLKYFPTIEVPDHEPPF